MADTLIFITKCFPVKNGEYFIDNEMPFLEQAFDKVIVIAVDAKGGKTDSRIQLKDSTDVFAFTSRSLKDKISIIMRMIGNLFIKEDKDLIKGSLKRRIQRAYLKSSADLIMSKILKIKQLRNIDGDILCYSYWFYDTAIVATKLAEKLDGKSVSRAHGYDLYEYLYGTDYLPFKRYIMNKSQVYTCSKQGSEYLKNRYPDYVKKIEHSYLGTLDHGVSDKKSDKIQILTCSNIKEIKRLDLLIDTLYVLKSRGIEFEWTHYGDGNLKEYIMGLAKDKLKENYRFMGVLQNKELMQEYSKNYYDVFINTSFNEGLPVSIIEACSFGIPVVATNVGGTSEVVIDGYNGYLVERDADASVIADKVMQLLRNEDYPIFRKNSRKIWEDNFNAVNNYTDFIKKIKE